MYRRKKFPHNQPFWQITAQNVDEYFGMKKDNEGNRTHPKIESFRKESRYEFKD